MFQYKIKKFEESINLYVRSFFIIRIVDKHTTNSKKWFTMKNLNIPLILLAITETVKYRCELNNMQ